MKIFGFIFYLIISSMFIIEVTIRAFPALIPGHTIEYLSENAFSNLLKSRGRQQEEGEAIYRYRAYQRFLYNPEIIIDELGFRNSVFEQQKVDTVLLGDSIVFGKGSETDLGDLFRQDGISALNLSMSGYAPQHYRDVYKRFIIDRDIQHREVLVTLFVGNDFSDSMRYPWKLEGNPQGVAYFPWVLNLIIGSIKNYPASRSYDKELKSSKNVVELPYKEIRTRYLWWPPEITEQQHQFQRTLKALAEINELALSQNSRVSIVIMPSPASVYGYKHHTSFKRFYDRHKTIVALFKKNLPEATILDPTDFLAKAIEKEFLYIAESDCHFNSVGMKQYYYFLTKY